MVLFAMHRSEDIHNQLRARFRGLQVQNPAKSSPLLECEYLRNDASQTKPSLDLYRCKGLNARPDQVNTLNDRETATLNSNTAQTYSIHTPYTYIGVHNNAARTKRPPPPPAALHRGVSSARAQCNNWAVGKIPITT